MNPCFDGRQPAHYGHNPTATWLPPHRHCGNGCVEVERETDTANRLRALIARMVELLPNEHPLAAEARQLLE